MPLPQRVLIQQVMGRIGAQLGIAHPLKVGGRRLVDGITDPPWAPASSTPARRPSLATGDRATHGTGTPRSTTGPLLGSSSTAWFTPAGVRTSIALGSCPSGTLHTPAVAPAGQRPKV